MARTATTLGFSVAPDLKAEIEAIAEIEGISKSQLFRDMVEAYKALKKEQEFYLVQRKISIRARESGVFSEKDIEKILNDDR